MAVFAVSTSQFLSADKLKELRYEAKTQYYQSHVLDLAVCDATLEDFVDDYIQYYYHLETASTHSLVSLASGCSSTKLNSKVKWILQRMTRKKL
ncbi:hypothetical protein ColLi_13865 [Colletotrichum liriopes]|uniref:Uncharacterized protein n=1 Tax=Colletotrichum liriopes TaxID=708192 RepID=A0AA37H1L7_9PEZI|nr:hypothetical protein ColLi_13865 [Colletotrichum liriopes]